MVNRYKQINKFRCLSIKMPSKNKGPSRARAKSQINLLKVTVTSYFYKTVTLTVTQLLLQSNLPTIAFYDIFAPQKSSFFENF